MAVREKPASVLRGNLREAVAWRWTAEWFRRHPDDLWLRRLSWPAEGDVLRIYAVRPAYEGHHADLPLVGRDAVRIYTSEWQFETSGLWEMTLELQSADETLNRLCADLQLTCHHPPIPDFTTRTLCYRVIEGLLGFTATDADAWTCESVVGTAASGCGVEPREDLLGAFPQLDLAVPEHAYPPGSMTEPAFGHWVITRNGEPQVCLSDQGTASFPDGHTLDLGTLFRESAAPGSPGRVAPVVAAVGASFLP